METQNKTFEEQYLEILKDVYSTGKSLNDRTGVGCRYKFGHMMKFSVSRDFPLLTTRKMSDFWLYEFNAFCVDHSTNISALKKYSNIWKPWADENGDLGPLYGEQVRKQLPELLNQMTNYVQGDEGSEKYARRFCMTMWNVEQLSDMRLAPCHGTIVQFDIRKCETAANYYRLDMFTYQRSADLVLGLPHNVCYYTLLMRYVCEYINIHNKKYKTIRPSTMNYGLGNYHIYNNQFDGVNEQLHRLPYEPPTISFYLSNVFDTKLNYYTSHPSIKFPEAAV